MAAQNEIVVEKDVDIPHGLSKDQEEVLSMVDIPDSLDIQITNSMSSVTEQMNELFEFVRNMYENVLSPQLKENEKLKREHKTILMNNLFKILKGQFVFTYIFVLALIIGTLASSWLKLSEVIVKDVIQFVEFYITSIVVELLAILFFIVKNVFDKSIVDLIRNFDKHDNKMKKQKE